MSTKYRSFKKPPTLLTWVNTWIFFLGCIIGVVFTLVFMTQCELSHKNPLFHKCIYSDSLEVIKEEARLYQAVILEYEKDSLDFQEMK